MKKYLLLLAAATFMFAACIPKSPMSRISPK